MIVVGIDPGIHGAVAILDGGLVVDVWDIPTLIDHRGDDGAEQRVVAIPALMAEMSGVGLPHRVFVERVQGFRSDSGSAAFAFGRTAGIIEACVVAVWGIVPQMVPPPTWRKHFGIRSKKGDKRPVVDAAMRHFDGQGHLLTGPRGGAKVDRCEAALIALYGERTANGR